MKVQGKSNKTKQTNIVGIKLRPIKSISGENVEVEFLLIIYDHIGSVSHLANHLFTL